MELPKFLTVKELAETFRVNKSTVSNWIADEVIPREYVVRPSGNKQGCKILINEKAVEHLMEPPPEKDLKIHKKPTTSGREKLIHFF